MGIIDKFREIESKSKEIYQEIYVYVEGEETEKPYFDLLKTSRYAYKNIKFNIIKENNVNLIKKEIKEIQEVSGIESVKFYIVQDFDRYCSEYYGQKGGVESACHQKNIQSNCENINFVFTSPTFEYNLYLHLENNTKNVSTTFFTNTKEIIKKINSILNSKFSTRTKNFSSLLEQEYFFTSGIDKLLTNAKETLYGEEENIKKANKKLLDDNNFVLSHNFSMLGLLIEELDSYPDTFRKREEALV